MLLLNIIPGTSKKKKEGGGDDSLEHYVSDEDTSAENLEVKKKITFNNFLIHFLKNQFKITLFKKLFLRSLKKKYTKSNIDTFFYY